MTIFFSLCFLVSLVVLVSTASISDTTMIDDSCSKFDSCHTKSEQRTCSCEEDCQMYGICCYDSNKRMSSNSSMPFQCYQQRTVTPVFVKRSCVDDYKGHVANVHACFDDDIDEMDVRGNILVTSHKTKITYWNYFCAICNYESKNNLELWNIEVYCPPRDQVDRSLIRTNLTFDEVGKQWGLNIEGEFVQCIVKYSEPPYIDGIKYCTPDLISSCPDGFSKENITSKCLEYYGERKLKNSDKYYKNAHCAICNGFSVEELECSEMVKEDLEETDIRDMVEEVFPNGQWLEKEKGQRYLCSSGFSYDPIQERCRRDEKRIKHIVVNSELNSSQTLRLELWSCLVILLAFLFQVVKGTDCS